jgi:hypothetical protein
MTPNLDVMFGLPPALAKRVAGIATCASSDPSRPTLEGIEIRWETGTEGDDQGKGYPTLELTFTATDSFLLGTRTFTIVNTGQPWETFETTPDKGSVLVEAKTFAKALVEAAKAPPGTPDKMWTVIVSLDDGGATVTNHKGTVMHTVHVIDAEFPKWEQLMPDPKVYDLSTLDGETPFFNPEYVRRALDGVGKLTKREREGMRPMRMFFDGRKDTHLRPFGYEVDESKAGSTATYGTYTAIQMPVRV